MDEQLRLLLSEVTRKLVVSVIVDAVKAAGKKLGLLLVAFVRWLASWLAGVWPALRRAAGRCVDVLRRKVLHRDAEPETAPADKAACSESPNEAMPPPEMETTARPVPTDERSNPHAQ